MHTRAQHAVHCPGQSRPFPMGHALTHMWFSTASADCFGNAFVRHTLPNTPHPTMAEQRHNQWPRLHGQSHRCSCAPCWAPTLLELIMPCTLALLCFINPAPHLPVVKLMRNESSTPSTVRLACGCGLVKAHAAHCAQARTSSPCCFCAQARTSSPCFFVHGSVRQCPDLVSPAAAEALKGCAHDTIMYQTWYCKRDYLVDK